MSVISGLMLAQMRAMVLARLPDVAVISAITNTSDGAGGWSEGLVTSGTVACRVDPLGANATESQVVVSREALEVTYRLTLPHDAPIAQNNRVVINGRTYEVVAVSIDHSWNVSKRVIITEVR